MKIDCRGTRIKNLEGALETIKKYMSVIMVEILKFEGNPIYDLLISLDGDEPTERHEKVYVFEPKPI